MKNRFSLDIIQYAVWLYFAFPLSFRDVELLLLPQRGFVVNHETIRSWCNKFGSHFEYQLRKRYRKSTDKVTRVTNATFQILSVGANVVIDFWSNLRTFSSPKTSPTS